HSLDDPFRIALIDMQMPGMDGEALGRVIRADKRLTATRMVMLTSLGHQGDALRFYEIGFVAYAIKPIRHQELKAVISLALAEQPAEPVIPPDEKTEKIKATSLTKEAFKQFTDHKVRILIVEDNPINQQVALGVLKNLGLRADAVSDGAEAVHAIKTIHYDLLLMDMQMPIMDGLEATKEIRKYEASLQSKQTAHAGSSLLPPDSENTSVGGVPIIALTANALPGDRETCIKAGMNDYISKPVSAQALADVIECWLPGGKNTVSNASQTEFPAAELSSSSSPVFDYAGFLARLGDDEELARSLFASFLQDMPPQIASLRDYLKKMDYVGSARQAHTIKGAAANLGGESLRSAATLLEAAAKLEDLAASISCLVVVEAEFERLRQAMEKEL
ncbi:MAG: response regulator, partial [bacterium]